MYTTHTSQPVPTKQIPGSLAKIGRTMRPLSMRIKGILQPEGSASTLTLATVRRVDEARGCGNLVEFCAVIHPANQPWRTPDIVVRVAVCDRVKDTVKLLRPIAWLEHQQVHLPLLKNASMQRARQKPRLAIAPNPTQPYEPPSPSPQEFLLH